MATDGYSLGVAPFADFVERVRIAARGNPTWTIPRQVAYLQSYLRNFPNRPARTLIIERPYVDRHYVDEYAAYYATALHPPPAHATRLHVLSSLLTEDNFSELLRRAAAGNPHIEATALEREYLGFITIRPIPSAPIGRTLLAHYGEFNGRLYDTVVRNCVARIAGLEVRFDALPFHQQEQGVGACASVALWSALAKAARDAGMRAPAPYAVTLAATRNLITDRVIPAVAGLELAQLANGMREFGFAPYTVKVAQQPNIFLWTLKTYLRSGIAPVLLLRDSGEDHAVVVAGHKESDQELVSIGTAPRVLQTHGLRRVYVHDDRIGPYVKMTLSVETRDEWPIIRLQRLPVDQTADRDDSKLTEDTSVHFAIYPLYPKLRLTAADLAQLAAELAPLFRHLVTAPRAAGLTVEPWFAQNGAYLRELFEIGADADRVEHFVRTTMLSRYVGVLRWFLEGKALADVVCDTTDIRRDFEPYAAVLGIFFFNRTQGERAAREAEELIPNAVLV